MITMTMTQELERPKPPELTGLPNETRALVFKLANKALVDASVVVDITDPRTPLEVIYGPQFDDALPILARRLGIEAIVSEALG